MELKFQLLDCDYFMNGNKPIIRLFGKTADSKTACAFVEGFDPYFYILPKDFEDGAIKKIENFLNENFKQNIKKIEIVKKFLPIGYQNDKTDLLKIILVDPSKVPMIREALIEKNSEIRKSVKDVFEADILFKYRFMADNNMSGLGTIKATGTPASTTTIKSNCKISASKIDPVADEMETQFKYMSVDIEVVPGHEGLPDARRDEIAMISMAFHPKHSDCESIVLITKPIKALDNTVRTFPNEKEMLKEFARIVDLFDPDVFIGYNINGFDMPFIIERFRQRGIPCMLGRCNMKPATYRKFGIRYRNAVVGRVIADAYELIKESVSKGLIRLKRYGLGDVSKVLLNEDKIDIAHSEIGKYWNGDSEKLTKLISYSRKDSMLALKLVLEKNMLDKFIELSKVSGILLQDVLSGGESTRVEHLLLRKFNEAGFVIPCKPSAEETTKRNIEREKSGLTGALVLEPERGLQTGSVVYLDFKSMYPSIYISYNICPTTILSNKTEKEIEKEFKSSYTDTPYGTKFVSKEIRKGIIPQIVESLIVERDRVKKEMHSEKSKSRIRELDAKQLALKIMANAFYGYTGYIQAKLYLLDIANAITSCGRYLIQKTKETVEEDKRFKVIYGDTDSIMVKTNANELDDAFKLGLEIEKVINERLSGIVKIKIEGIFKSLLILTKKRYAGWLFEKGDEGWDGKILTKGIETIRRDWCDLAGETLYKILEIILKKQNPKEAFEYVREVLKKLQKNEIPIESLVLTKSITKPIKSYKGVQPHVEVVKKMRKRNPSEAPGVGDRIGFIIVQGTQLLSNRAEDPDYAKQHGLKVDSKYYIESQLIPPLERVFEAMGVNKSELLGTGKQTLLSAIFKKERQQNQDQDQNHRDRGNKENSEDEPLSGVEGLVCEKCGKTYDQPPLVGKCVSCGGPILFFKGHEKSKYLLIA